MNRTVAQLLLTAGVLTACQTPPPVPPPVAPAPIDVPVPVAPAPPAPPPPTGPVSAAAQQQAQKAALVAVDALESGHEEAARTELKRALGLDPQNKLALNLARQVINDPVEMLGRDSFAYTVRSSDTLSRIAGRFLGDLYAFYILARYNGIAVPKQVSTGQVLRIPGKAPAPGSNPAPVDATPRTPPVPTPPKPPAPPLVPLPLVPSPLVTPTPVPAPPVPPPPAPVEIAMRDAAAAERAGDLARARSAYLRAASLGHPGAAAKAEQAQAQLIERLVVDARRAFARQKLGDAITLWQRVLELAPNHPEAPGQIKRLTELKKKFDAP